MLKLGEAFDGDGTIYRAAQGAPDERGTRRRQARYGLIRAELFFDSGA